jgi:pancreatic triacylglycerol lipase
VFVGAQTVDYAAARNRVSEVGNLVGRMANFLFQNGNSFATMSIIGHSLGGHTAGIAGKSASLGMCDQTIFFFA